MIQETSIASKIGIILLTLYFFVALSSLMGATIYTRQILGNITGVIFYVFFSSFSTWYALRIVRSQKIELKLKAFMNINNTNNGIDGQMIKVLSNEVYKICIVII